MAQSIISATPAVMAMNVHVTGRRVLATIVDGIVLGVLFAVMSILFGESSTSGTSVNFSMGTFPTLGFFVLAMAYYILMEGYLGQTVGKMVLGIKAHQLGQPYEVTGRGIDTVRWTPEGLRMNASRKELFGCPGQDHHTRYSSRRRL